VKNPTTRLSSYNQNGVAGTGKNQDQGQNSRAGIANLIGHGKHHASQDKMNQRSGFPFRELEKGNHQSSKASDRYHIKECCHLSNDTNP
jgi:hypothetical protein